MNVLAIIPAKGQSSRIPRKNVRPLGGRPLFLWTVEAALDSRASRVVVSTEDEVVAGLASAAGAEVLARPAELARDPAEAQDVAVHVVRTLQEQGYRPDVAVMLLPTSPFRTGEHIDDAVGLHAYTGRDIVSVISRPEAKHKWVARGEDGLVWAGHLEHPMELNGAIWVSTPERILRHGGFSIEAAIAFPMTRETGLDIDRPIDWALAEALLESRRAVAA